MSSLRFASPMPASADELFAWHTRDGAFERLTPPWNDVRVRRRRGDLRDGEVELSVPMGPLRGRWLARHSDYVEGRQFVDTQVAGPFARWIHSHRTVPASADTSTLDDTLDFALPLDPLSRPALPVVRRMLRRMFAYRHAVTALDLARHRLLPRPLRIGVTGASGLVGRALVPMLTTGGHDVVRLVRRRPITRDEHEWRPDEGITDPARLGHLDAVVHLAGENVAATRWTPAVKARIRDSRVGPTARLAASLGRLPSPPVTFVSASAIGYYGDRGDMVLTERDGPGRGFLPETCVAWEQAASEAAPPGLRVVQPRLGIVLDSRGGALKSLLWPFRLGLGGPLGHGRQYFSWISMEDVLGGLLFLLGRTDIQGPVNLTAPAPSTNADFARTLAATLRRPALGRVPAWLLRLLVGEMADAELLASKRVQPATLLDAGYRFAHPRLDDCLTHTLGLRELTPAP